MYMLYSMDYYIRFIPILGYPFIICYYLHNLHYT